MKAYFKKTQFNPWAKQLKHACQHSSLVLIFLGNKTYKLKMTTLTHNAFLNKGVWEKQNKSWINKIRIYKEH